MPKVSTNQFNLDHDVKTSFRMGELIPTAVIETLPGDSFNIDVQNMMRFAAMLAPTMHKIRVRTDYFFVPNRLLWSEWPDWITNKSDVLAPFLQIAPDTEVQIGSLADYIGIPTGTYPANLRVSPMALAAYLLIYDEYYRDQNLAAEKFVPLVAGNNTTAYEDYLFSPSGDPLLRAWQRDYFTAALPEAQQGDEVMVPLTQQDNIPVDFMQDTAAVPVWRNPDDSTVRVGAVTGQAVSGEVLVGGQLSALDPDGTLTVDVQAGATSIETLRTAFRLQEWLEKNIRGGQRYIEMILSHFGVKSSDARLQRPELIGSFHHNMVISEVLSTAETVTNPVGQMSGHGISVGGVQNMRFRCEEHGFIIGIVSVTPDTAYMQGLHKMFSRFDQLDYAFPTFAHLGEQPIQQKEVFATSANPTATFGYIPRYSEYKFLNSRASGDMRDTLAYWHLARIFATDPALNEEFIKCTTDDRIFAFQDPANDHVYAHIFNRISAVRKLPRFGIPSI